MRHLNCRVLTLEHKNLEVFSETSNYAIVRMPGRSFPGMVVQGDSLSILCNHARSIHRLATRLGDAELLDEIAELQDLLEDRLRHYEEVLAEHNMRLPYTKRTSEDC